MHVPAPSSPAGRLLAAPRLLRTRIEDNIADHGLVYPWWIPLISGLGMTAAALGAIGLRHQWWPPAMPIAMVLLVAVPGVVQVVMGRHFPHLVETVCVLVAASILLINPVHGQGKFDVAPALLALLTAEVVARDGVRNGLVTAAISTAMLVTAAARFDLKGLPVHLVDLPLGFAVGYMLLWQMRALQAERVAREGDQARATLAERQRIAREIHDLVAHSLSVTLLQIAGARHALRDVRGAEDVSDADAALADAERVGRQAMADIRQTVSTLADGPADTHALPTAADIGDLVEQMGRAGLSIRYDEVGEPARLAQATGLGVYRIAQESLANIAKHAPDGPAQVQFTVTQTSARLIIRNPRACAEPEHSDAGSGLAGMRARAEQLGAALVAGPDGSDWLVDLKVQLRERDGMLWCPKLVRRMAW